MWRKRSATHPPFANRRDAGRQLADALAPLVAGIPHERLLILGLARGGVVLAAEVAHELGAELDACVVRKIGAPTQPELAIGAVGPGDHRLYNRHLIRSLNLSAEGVRSMADAVSAERNQLDAFLRNGRPGPGLDGRTVVLVDDGLATGASMRAALAWAKESTDAVIIAVPVAPPDVIEIFESLGAQVVCLLTDKQFGAVGTFYGQFEEVSSDRVRALLTGSTDSPRPSYEV
jgi:putative phosphoribosyl transferase